MQRFSRWQGRITRTAALIFFIVLVVADGIISFYYVRDQLSVVKLGWFRTFIPVVQAVPTALVHSSQTPSAQNTAASGPATHTPIPPTAAALKKYIVQAGDTLFKIASEYGLTVDALAKANQIENVDMIRVGQELIIPAPGVTETPIPPSATPTPTNYPPPESF